MDNYQVYGLGNALVDIDIEVDETKLLELGVDKGVMTLVDVDRQQYLLSELALLPQLKACGGSAANTMIAVSQLGGKGYYSCKVANDESGTFFLKDLLSHGLSTNLSSSSREPGVTGKCLVLVTPDADRTMNTYLGITESFSSAQLDVTAIAHSDFLYVEGYLATSITGQQAALDAKRIAEEAGTQTSMTLSDPNMTQFFDSELSEMIGDGVDLLFCNQQEALLFSKTNDLKLACDYLQRIAKRFVITQGPDGALLYDGDYTELPGYSVKAVDTVGAGDMFAGAFLYGLTHGASYLKAAEMANLSASRVVAKHGPRLDATQAQQLKYDLSKMTVGEYQAVI